MEFWKMLSKLDRRIIFALVFLAVLLPLIFKIGLPIKGIQPPVKAIYDHIEKLPEGSTVLISVSYSPSTMPELYPMTLAVIRHCFRHNIKVVCVSLVITGVGIGEMALQEAAKEYNKQEGTDYVNLGFQAGPVTLGMGQDIHKTYPADYKGTKIEELSVMKNVRTYKDIGLIVDYTASATGYIGTAVTMYNANLAVGVTAVGAADLYPYLQTNQIIGLMGGLRSAAEYEILINRPDKGCIRMDSQSIAHLLILVLIVIGNIAYFMTRSKKA